MNCVDLTKEVMQLNFLNFERCPGGQVVSTSNFRSQDPRFKSQLRWNSALEHRAFHYQVDLNNVECDIHH